MNPAPLDVLIVGGGPVGLACALLLAPALSGRAAAGARIGLLEQRPPHPPGPETDLRVVALSPASRNILQACAAWDGLDPARVFPYVRMCVWESGGEPGGRRSIVFDAAELNMAALGCIVETELLRHAMWCRLAEEPLVRIFGGRPMSLHLGEHAARVSLDDGEELHARLVIGADGAASWVRERLGVPVDARAYGQRAVVTHVSTAHPHRQTAWQRFAPGGPLALLPLDERRCSVVWSRPERAARELLDCGEQEFGLRLTEASAGVLGDLQPCAPRAAFPLARLHARTYTGRRFALIGDAAHQIHPLAGQGINLGLLDAAALAEVLALHLGSAHADAGDPVCLRRYERWRKGSNQLMLGAMDVLHRLFAGDSDGLRLLAGAGMRLAGGLAPLRLRLAQAAMGLDADSPHAARPRVLVG